MYLSGRRTIRARVRAAQVYVVEKVEQLPLKLKALGFGQLNVPCQRPVGIEEPRSAKDVPRRIPHLVRCGLDERLRVIPE